MKNATSHTMGPILPSTPTQHRYSLRKITHTHTHARTHARISYESNRSQAHIKKSLYLFFYKAYTCSLLRVHIMRVVVLTTSYYHNCWTFRLTE